MTNAWWAIAGVMVCIEACGAQVFVRGQVEAMEGQVTGVALEGVSVTRAGGKSVLVGLDVVRDVKGEHSGEFEALRAFAEASWRGRSRVERNDFGAAEPVLEELAGRLHTASGPSVRGVYDALLRCRLARGAFGASVAAWLHMLRAEDARLVPGGQGVGQPALREEWIGGMVNAPVIVDPATHLVPGLPPMFVSGMQSESAAGQLDGLAAGTGAGSGMAGRLALYYRAAAAIEAGVEAAIPDDEDPSEGVRLVRDIVLARGGNEQQRMTGRERLSKRLQDANIAPWMEAWCRAGLGRSLIHESEQAVRRRGVLELLHVPSRLSRHAPGLSELCLSEAARTMEELGDTAGAWVLGDELAKSAPDSPYLKQPTIQGIRARAAPPGVGAGDLPGRKP